MKSATALSHRDDAGIHELRDKLQASFVAAEREILWLQVAEDLSSAIDLESFCRSTTRSLRALIPSKSILFWLSYVDFSRDSQALAILEHPRVERSREWWAGRRRHHLTVPYLLAHPGIEAYRMSDAVQAGELLKSAFYRRYMEPNGWRYAATLCFWDRRSHLMKSSIAVYRSARQGDFGIREMETLRKIHTLIELALERAIEFEQRNAEIERLQHAFRRLAVPILLLDAKLNVRFASVEARQHCQYWEHGEAARALTLGSDVLVPEPVRALCLEMLRSEWNTPEHRTVVHRYYEELSATVHLLHSQPPTLESPGFLIRFERQPKIPIGLDHPVSAEDLLSRLSRAERAVLALILRGLTSKEIGVQLSKSEGTVKLQTRSIFRKLGVDNRTKLVLLFPRG